MKRFIILLAMLFVSVPAFANSYQNLAGNSASTLSRRAPDQILFDTTTTTTTLGLPVYTGYGVKGSDVGDSDWLVCKSSEAASVTTTNCAYGSWTGRAALTYN